MLGVRRGRLGAGARRPASTGASVVGAGSALPAARRGRGGRGCLVSRRLFSGKEFRGTARGRPTEQRYPPPRAVHGPRRPSSDASGVSPTACRPRPSSATHTHLFFAFCFVSQLVSQLGLNLGLETFFFVSRGLLSSSSSSSSGQTRRVSLSLGPRVLGGGVLAASASSPVCCVPPPRGGLEVPRGRRPEGGRGRPGGGGFGDGTGRGWLPALQLRVCG